MTRWLGSWAGKIVVVVEGAGGGESYRYWRECGELGCCGHWEQVQSEAARRLEWGVRVILFHPSGLVPAIGGTHTLQREEGRMLRSLAAPACTGSLTGKGLQ